MKDILLDLSPPSMIHAIEENLFAQILSWSHCAGVEPHSEPELQWILSSIPYAYFNSIMQSRLPPGYVDTVIENAIARCAARGVPSLSWTGPSSTPANLGAALEAHGFAHDGDYAGMAIDLDSLNEHLPSPAALRIEPVRDEGAMRIWCEVAIRGFEMPAFIAGPFFELFSAWAFGAEPLSRNYLGWLDGEPVATSLLFPSAGVAGIYAVVTLPEARRKGIGAALTLAALREARRLGYRIAILHASPPGFNIYRQLGFQEYCKIGMYIWSPDQSQQSKH